MNYAQLYWNNSNFKMEKSYKVDKNKILEKEIERNLEIKDVIDNNDIYNSFPKSDNIDINMANFRESIEINLESRYNNRDIIEKRLNKREKLKNGWFNPYMPKSKYVEDLNDENNYLRPRNTYQQNKKLDKSEENVIEK